MPNRFDCLACVLLVSMLIACGGEDAEDCTNKVGANPPCACDDDYVGMGTKCVDGDEVDIDECAGINCGDGGSCTHAIGETTPGNYTCACASGYEGGGVKNPCRDIDECAGINCGDGGSCTHAIGETTPGNYTCACASGYDGGGVKAPCRVGEDGVICPITDVMEDPVVVRKFQDNELEHEATQGRYRVIVPADYAAIADDLLAILPECETYIETFLGYCRPWSKSIIHLGVYSTTKSKVENGVVYMGRRATVFSNWIQRDYWGQVTRTCGDTTLAHETMHTFQTSHAPAWLKEGQAQYLADAVLGQTTYRCNAIDMEICFNTACTTYPYWDLSNNNWEGGNKHLYYKTGACFWKVLTDAYDKNKLRDVTRSLGGSPLEAVGVFPFSAQTNALIINHHFVPYLGSTVWQKIARFGISANE